MFAPVALATTLLLASTTGPTDTVRQGNDEIQRLLETKDATVERLAARADDFVDFAELARRALGKEWSKLTPRQREEFTVTMKGLLRASYAQRALKEGKSGGSAVTYGKESVAGNEATVATRLKVKADEFPIEYRLYRATDGARWRIYDVITDDVSLLETYQDQFRKLIADKGFAGLLATLKSKKEKLDASAAAQPVRAN